MAGLFYLNKLVASFSEVFKRTKTLSFGTKKNFHTKKYGS